MTYQISTLTPSVKKGASVLNKIVDTSSLAEFLSKIIELSGSSVELLVRIRE